MKQTDEYIAFTKVKLPYGWMSNFSPHPVEYNGKVWKTSEHLFMAMRVDFAPIIGTDIWREKNPMMAKRKAKAYIKENNLEHLLLTERDVNIMRTVVQHKLDQHPELVEELLATEHKTIYEDVSKRIGDYKSSSLFWGAAHIQEKFWIGKNWLGKIYMEERHNRFYSFDGREVRFPFNEE
jgi:ribA/ribD-fused uncharacterized protein